MIQSVWGHVPFAPPVATPMFKYKQKIHSKLKKKTETQYARNMRTEIGNSIKMANEVFQKSNLTLNSVFRIK